MPELSLDPTNLGMDDILARIASFAGESRTPNRAASTAQRKSQKLPSIVKNVTDEIPLDTISLKEVSTRSNRIGFLCFSKDRPFQLDQYLISSRIFLSSEKNSSIIVVLYSPGEFRDLYNGVFLRHPEVIPFEELDEIGFAATLLQSLESITDAVGSDGFICLCVDDLIFIDKVDTSYLIDVLAAEAGSRVLGFHLKLHPGIMYSHAAGQVCRPPVLIGCRLAEHSSSSILTYESGNAGLGVRVDAGVVGAGERECPASGAIGVGEESTIRSGTGSPIAHLEFEHSGSAGDWKYVLDLCAGLYRIADIRYLLGRCIAAHGMDSIANPNILEVSLNNAFWEEQGIKISPTALATSSSTGGCSSALSLVSLPRPHQLSQYSRSGCVCAPCLKVVTVNRVQSTYAVPTYDTLGGDIHTLNSLCGIGAECSLQVLDFNKYASDISVSVHVGDLYWKSTHTATAVSCIGPPVPVIKCDDSRVITSGSCATVLVVDTDSSPPCNSSSIPRVTVLIPVRNGQQYLAQCLHSLLTHPQKCTFEVLLVDDGSSDNTVGIAEGVQMQVLRGTFFANPGVSLEIVKLGPVGLAAALHHGLLCCRGEYVARLDSDDLCQPGRLGRQRDYLDTHKGVHVVGGQAVVIGEDAAHRNTISSSGSGKTVQKCGEVAAGYPTAPSLVHWGMLFRCCLIHPSVMFRKAEIMQCGSYINTPFQGSEIRTDHEGADEGSVEDPGEVDSIEDYSLWARVLKRFPCSIANLPDVVVQLRKRQDSKSATQATALTAASDALRWQLVCHTLDLEDSAQRVCGAVGVSGVEMRAKWGVVKESLDRLLHPTRHVKGLSDVCSAMALLSLLFEAFLKAIGAGVGCVWGRGGSLGPGIGTEESCILDEMLCDAMRGTGKQVYHIAKAREAAASMSIPKGSVRGGRESESEVCVGWEDLYCEADVQYFKTVTAADVIRDLTAFYS